MLAALLSPSVGQDLYTVRRALTRLGDLDQPRGDTKKVKTEKEVYLGSSKTDVVRPSWGEYVSLQ